MTSGHRRAGPELRAVPGARLKHVAENLDGVHHVHVAEDDLVGGVGDGLAGGRFVQLAARQY